MQKCQTEAAHIGQGENQPHYLLDLPNLRQLSVYFEDNHARTFTNGMHWLTERLLASPLQSIEYTLQADPRIEGMENHGEAVPWDAITTVFSRLAEARAGSPPVSVQVTEALWGACGDGPFGNCLRDMANKALIYLETP